MPRGRKQSKKPQQQAQQPSSGLVRLAEVRVEVCTALKMGIALDVALRFANVPDRTQRDWRARAKAGDQPYVEFFEACLQAEAEAEVRDVVVTAKAARPERAGAHCPKCNHVLEVDLAEVDGSQRVMSDAARIALERLARRFPKRWSPTTRVSIEDEQEAFLTVARRVLAPDVYEQLLNAYLSEVGDPDAVAEQQQDPSPIAPGDGGAVH